MPFKVTTRLSIRYKLLPVVEVATEVSDLEVAELSGHKNLTFSHHKFQNICRPNGFVCKNLRWQKGTNAAFLEPSKFKVEHSIVAKTGFERLPLPFPVHAQIDALDRIDCDQFESFNFRIDQRIVKHIFQGIRGQNVRG